MIDLPKMNIADATNESCDTHNMLGSTAQQTSYDNESDSTGS